MREEDFKAAASLHEAAIDPAAELAAANAEIDVTEDRRRSAEAALNAIKFEGFTGKNGETLFAFNQRLDAAVGELGKAENARDAAERWFVRAKEKVEIARAASLVPSK
jgi:hypothetical protein